MPRAIGFSTGVLLRVFPNISLEMINFLRNVGCNAIELNCIEESNLWLIEEKINPVDLVGFDYVSLHAPCYKYFYRNDEQTRKVLEQIQRVSDIFNIACVVIHPDRVEDWRIFESFSFKIGIENLDVRKSFGRAVAELESVFKLDDRFGFVLDVNHCFSLDKSMILADDLMRNFGDRLLEIHLSGYNGYHEPLFITRQEKIIAAVPKNGAPIIIESVLNGEKDIVHELDFVRKNFK